MVKYMKYDELVSKIRNGSDHIQVEHNEVMPLVDILLNHSYAICITDGDFDNLIKVSWVYAGEPGALDYADMNNIVFSHQDYLDMLLFNEYEADEDEE